MDNIREQLKEKIFSKYRKDTWEIKTLGEIAIEIISGSDVRKDQMNSGSFPAIRYKDIHDSEITLDKCVNFVDPKIIRGVKYVETNYLLIAKVSENVKDSGKACAYLGKERAIIGGGTFAIKHNQNPKFLSYICSSKFVREQIQNLSREGIVVNFTKSSLVQIKIPLPSLEIQQKIVEFLDKYIELERELEMRKKQYEYYRDNEIEKGIEKLKWEIKKMGEIANDIYIGNSVRREDLGTGDHPAVKAGDINSSLGVHFKECISLIDQNLIKEPKYFETGDILFAKLSNKIETLGISAYLGEKKGILGDGVYTLKHNQNPKYLAFVLSSDYCKQQIKRRVQKGTVYHFYARDIKQIQIPLPTLDVQVRVVENLDKLYRIVHDFKEGIPFLIKKNREQYEFYRELLLEK